MTPQPIAIIIPAFNQLDYCRQCVDSIRANTREPYQLILVDNGSTDGVGEYFDCVPGARVIHAERNLGFPGGVNLGMRGAEGHVLLLNSDTIVPKGWLERLERALLSVDDIGMVGPMSNYVSGPQQIPDLMFESQEQIDAFAEGLAIRNAGKLTDIGRLVGFCVLIRDTVFQAVGLLDESFGIGCYEDDDYGIRVRKAGYRLCMAEDAFVFHYGSRTFTGMGISREGMEGLLAANETRFAGKWGNAQAAEDRERSLARNAEARTAAAAGDARKALMLLKEAVEACPFIAANYNDLGAVLWQAGEHEKAFKFFIRAVGMNPEYAEARANLRDAAQALGRTKEAEVLLNGWHE